ncbi:hypothetical protein PINS_up017195 [Pythium insidiosum]|nr:hypothetical protein PINS_up017195 [Pythium insidiosum]
MVSSASTGRLKGNAMSMEPREPNHRTPNSAFAVLGDLDDTDSNTLAPKKTKTLVPSTPADAFGVVGAPRSPQQDRDAEDDRSVGCGYAISIGMWSCLIAHIAGLLVFFTSFYNDVLQVALFRRFFWSLRSFQDDVDARRQAVAFIYLLLVGLVPSLAASGLWALSKRLSPRPRRHNHRSMPSRLEQFWRRKPLVSLPSALLRRRGDGQDAVYLDFSMGELVFALGLLSCNVFIFAHVVQRAQLDANTPADRVFQVLGRAFGYNALFCMAWLLLPLIKRSVWIELFGVSFPQSVKYHRWLTYIVLSCSILHAMCYVLCFERRGQLAAELLPTWGAMYRDTSTRDANGVNAFGELALLAVLVTAASSLPCFKDRCFSFASYIRHIGLSIFVLAACIHHPQTMWWLLPSLLMLLIERISAWSHRRYPVEVVDMAPLPNGITRLVCRRRNLTHGRDDLLPGQFVYLHVPRLSWFQWHPFAIASSPCRHPDTFKCYAKAVHPTRTSWTNGLHDLSKLAFASMNAPVIHVDGYYGPTNRSYYDRYQCLVLVAGGIGFVQVSSVLEELFHNAQAEAIASSGELSTGRQVWVLWTSRDVCLYKEFEELLTQIRVLDPHERRFKMRFFLTKIPTREELLYVPVPPTCYDKKQTMGDSNDDCRAQNHTGWLGWVSRPFAPSVSSRSRIFMSLVAVTIVVIPIAVFNAMACVGHRQGGK